MTVENLNLYRKALSFYEENKALDGCNDIIGYVLQKIGHDIEKEALEIQKEIGIDYERDSF